MKRLSYAFFLIFLLGALVFSVLNHQNFTLVQLIPTIALCLGLIFALIDEQKGLAVLIGVFSLILVMHVFGFLFGAPFPNPLVAIFIIAIVSGLLGRWRTLRSRYYF